MKIILNEDVKHLGEYGDVKNVANGYARNFLFPHNYAVPYTPETVKFFETKKEEIEARKAKKRADNASLKEKIEALAVELEMPAGANGKLYGAVTNLTIAEFYTKNNLDVERKRIEIPGVTIKNVGNYTFKVHLYETIVAEAKLVVKAQPTNDQKTEQPKGKRTSKNEEKAAVSEENAEASSEESKAE